MTGPRLTVSIPGRRLSRRRKRIRWMLLRQWQRAAAQYAAWSIAVAA